MFIISKETLSTSRASRLDGKKTRMASAGTFSQLTTIAPWLFQSKERQPDYLEVEGQRYGRINSMITYCFLAVARVLISRGVRCVVVMLVDGNAIEIVWSRASSRIHSFIPLERCGTLFI
jgi:hypothetical protein